MMTLFKVDPKSDWNSDRIQIRIYRDYQGLNMGNTWWNNHYEAKMVSAETICPNLHFLDIETNPTINNVYTNDSAVDGSRFQYNSLEKTPIKLNFWLQYTDYRDYIDKKHDIESYFSSKAGFVIQTNYHPAIHARCYVNKIEIKPTSAHDAIFTVTMDNATGMWFSNNTRLLEEEFGKYVVRDLRMPKSALQGGKPSWKLHPGENKIWIGGDCVIQFSNPVMQSDIYLYGCTSGVSIVNKTNNTSLVANNRKGYDTINGNYVWLGLDFGKVISINPKNRKVTYHGVNFLSSSTDFWLNPGWNTIELTNATSAYIDTSFYFSNF